MMVNMFLNIFEMWVILKLVDSLKGQFWCKCNHNWVSFGVDVIINYPFRFP